MQMRTALTMLLMLAGTAATAQQAEPRRADVAAASAEAATPAAPAATPARPAAEAPAAGAATPAGEPVVPFATVADAIVTQVLAQVPASGTLVAREEVMVYPQVSGFDIQEILVEAGDKVRAGQVLARLGSETLTAQLAQAAAEFLRAEAGVSQARSQIASTAAALNQATAALSRATRLQQSGNATQAALDQAVSAEAAARAAATSASDGLAVAQAQLAQAGAARDIARLNLARTEIKAPVAGIVSARNAQLGALAGAGAEPLFTLVAHGEIDLAAEVIETALPEIEPGDSVLANVAGVGEVPGKVRLVPARVDPTTRLGVLRIALDDERLIPGLFANALITTEQRDALTVPASAVTSQGHASHVLVVRDGRVERREVDAGLIWQNLREIRSGLTAGETVIARASAFFRDGDPVNAVREDGAGPAP